MPVDFLTDEQVVCFGEFFAARAWTRAETAKALFEVAVLVAEATNGGYQPVQRSRHRALNRARLSHVEQNCLRADTLAAANARLIEAQAEMSLAGLWGGGMVVSIDGLRFVVPTQTPGITRTTSAAKRRHLAQRHQRPGRRHRRHRHTRHRVGLTVRVRRAAQPRPRAPPGTGHLGHRRLLRSGLRAVSHLRQAIRAPTDHPARRPLLAPRPRRRYGAANDLARHRIKPDRIHPHWPEMLRIAGSLITGTVRAYDLTRALPRRQPHPTGPSVRRVRPHRENAASAGRGRPRRRHLPPIPKRAAQHHRAPPPARAQALLRPSRRTPPGLPTQHGRPTRRARTRPQRRRAVEQHLPQRRYRTTPGSGLSRRRR